MSTGSPNASGKRKGSKYRNRRFVKDGVRWDSEKEYARWQMLYQRFREGLIAGLRRQREFKFVINGIHVCSYVADFIYRQDGALVVEDVKSEITRKLRDYRIKRKLFRAIYGFDIREV